MRKYSVDVRRVYHMVRLGVTLLVLLGFFVHNVVGSASGSLLMEPNATISSPPVILQSGTVGTSTIYTNNTSAEGSVEGGHLQLHVNADDGAKTGWTRVGTNPFLDAVDYNASFLNASGNNMVAGDFDFDDSGKSTETINNVTVQVYIRQNETDRTIKIFVWNGTDWASGAPIGVPTSWGWINWTVTAILDTWTKIDGARMYLRTGSSTGLYEVDCARLLVSYTPNIYDYVLRVNNTVTDSWEIRLKKYSDSGINRLGNCTIYFRNSTNDNSTQIVIENGSFNQTEGSWYSLGSLETVYIVMMVEANTTGISSVYTYLDILTPASTTYARYIVALVIT